MSFQTATALGIVKMDEQGIKKHEQKQRQQA
jgi:hypothetical protein